MKLLKPEVRYMIQSVATLIHLIVMLIGLVLYYS